MRKIRWMAPVALFLAACSSPPEGPEPPRPNVVLIVVDTLRSDHLGCYGYSRPTSPRIDELAATSVRYRRAYSQAPWTTPSVSSLLTSLYPSTLGIREAPDRLADEFELLPEILGREGYATAAVISHYFLAARWNLDQGFDRFDESNVLGHGGVSSPGVTATALSMVDELGAEASEAPFFLLVHYFDPHYDYIEHPDHPFTDPAYEGPVSSAREYTELRDLAPSLSDGDVAQLAGLYDSEIAFTDRHLGVFLDGLRQRGLFDDALVVLTADHGEELRDRATIGHGHRLFDELIRVPLLVKYPGQQEGAVVETAVGLVDLFPTLLEYLEIPVGHPISGRSFLTAVPGEEPRRRAVFSETEWGRYRAVVQDGWKLVHHLPSGTHQLFELAEDPGETSNLVRHLAQDGRLARFEAMRDNLQGWIDFLDSTAGKPLSVDLSDEDRQRLRALGYLN